MSTKSRASLQLLAATNLSTEAALAAVRETAEQAGPGTPGIPKAAWTSVDTLVSIDAATTDRLELSITTANRRALVLCTLSAEAWSEQGTAHLRVGGLEQYRTSSASLFGFIPIGPKLIEGLAPYKQFLDTVQQALTRADPDVSVQVREPLA